MPKKIPPKKHKKMSFLGKHNTQDHQDEKITYSVANDLHSPQKKPPNLNAYKINTKSKKKTYDQVQQSPIPPEIQDMWAHFKELSLQDPLRHGGGVGSVNYYSADEATNTLYVSPNGDNTTGDSWSTAYTTLPNALSNINTGTNINNWIYIAPGTYNMDTTGDPTYAGNISLIGDHRHDVVIKNDHASATSVIKFTGRAVLMNVTIDCGTGSNNGVIIQGKGSRCYKTYFEAEDVTGAQTCLTLNGGEEYFKGSDIFIDGVQAYTTGIKTDNYGHSYFLHMDIHGCLLGFHFSNVADDNHHIDGIDFKDCTTAVKIASGVEGTQIIDYTQANCTTVFDDSGINTFFYPPDTLNYTELHYVSKEGDNSNGHTWKTAFTDLNTAIQEATTTQGFFEILIAPGDYDLATTNNLYTSNIALHALEEHTVVISNSVSTNYVFKVNTPQFVARNICIEPTGGQDGIEIETTDHGLFLDHVHVKGTGITSTATCLKITNGSYGRFDQIILEGNSSNTTGIDISNHTKARFDDCRIGNHNIGIQIQSGNSNVFLGPVRLNNNITAIDIDSGVTGTKLLQLELVGNTTNIVNDGTNTYFKRKDIDLEKEIDIVYPTAANAGIEVTTGVAGVWGSYAEINDGTNFTKPFKIISIDVGNTSADNDYYFVEIASGSAGSEETLAQIPFSGGKSPNIGTLQTGWLPAGTRIAARGQSSSGSDTFDVWIVYVNL